MPDEIDRLLEEVLVDAYGEDEQLSSFEQAFAETVRFPFRAQIVGTTVDVVKVDFDGDPRHGLVAVCRQHGQTHRVSLADLAPGPVLLATRRLIVAYRRWLCLPELEAERSSVSWLYRPVAMTQATVPVPLKLEPNGLWDPGDQYWGEEDEELDLDPLYEIIIAAGPRPQFEMEQVIPGVDSDDFDLDPIVDAAQLHAAGCKQRARTMLDGLLAQDDRCIDAWTHLGNFAFRDKGPKAALAFYDRGVAIGEQSLPDGFNGVLPRGLIDNRPFLRALHGLGLCAWRQRRWADAETIFTNLLWIDGCQTWDSLECLHRVQARERWTAD